MSRDAEGKGREREERRKIAIGLRGEEREWKEQREGKAIKGVSVGWRREETERVKGG